MLELINVKKSNFPEKKIFSRYRPVDLKSRTFAAVRVQSKNEC